MSVPFVPWMIGGVLGGEKAAELEDQFQPRVLAARTGPGGHRAESGERGRCEEERGVRELIRQKGWADYSEGEARDAASVMRSAKPRPKNGEVGNGRSSFDNIKATVGGTSSAYLASRIKRDHPDVAQAVERGEFRSGKWRNLRHFI